MFNTAEFTVSVTPVFTTLKQQRAVVDGRHPLDSWKHKGVGATSVVRKGTTVVVLVPSISVAGSVDVTTYEVTSENEANAILDQVRGKITRETMWSTFSKNTKWSGGPITLTEAKTFYHLVSL